MCEDINKLSRTRLILLHETLRADKKRVIFLREADNRSA